MKKIRFMLAALAALMLAASCQEEKELKPSGSDERSITSIKLEGQLGEAAVPEIIDAENGRIDVQIATALCEDMTKVKVEELVISYKATASVEVGGTIDLSSGVAEIVVTAESGKSRTYKVYCDAFTEPFEGKYAVVNTAMVGGVGDPSWGGIELIDPIEKKDWLFQESIANGTGPAASNDDYFEIKCTKINEDGSTEGTCTLYGGVDGKHWDCMYHLQYDLKSTFRVIPLGTSYWHKEYKAEGAVIIFKKAATDKDTVGVCKVYNETTTIFTKNGENKDLVLESGQQALAFQLNGDTSWPESDQFTDYVKFVRSPIGLFVRVKKVDEIPAESMTEGTMGDLQVEDPGTDPDPGDDDPDPVDPATFLKGTFKVKSLKLLGGAGSTGFVEVKEKNMWDNTIDNEYDNKLVLNPSTTALAVTYLAGEDGAFWDYTMLAEKNRLGTGAVDLSYNFDRLPRKTTDATVNLTTGAVTIGETAGQAFFPGSYTIEGIKGAKATLKVDDNCFAIMFQCTPLPEDQYTYDSNWAWGDFERFLIYPSYYALIFEKESDDTTVPEIPDEPDPIDPSAFTGTFKLTNLQMLGGLYGNKFIEFSEKATSFSASLENEYDNKMVLVPTGVNGSTVTASVTYAPGADGKYWDYTLLASANLLGTGDYDMSDNVKKLPHATAEATLNLEEGTFAVGSTAGQALLPGEYPIDLSSYNGGKGTITVPEGSIGLVFQCTQYSGSYTFDWNNWLYKDGDRFMLHPFVFVMIFAKESNDTTIPEIPDEPGDDPADDGISGTYKVKSLMHVGGAYCSSAINLVDKKVCFNSSFDTEYDNLLVVQASGAADGNVSVSLDYQAGADNGYWDGKFVAQYNKVDTSTDMDLSHDLCALPHGKSTGLINTSTGALTIGESSFTLAYPGTYPFERTSTGTKGSITVPDGCIGVFIPCKGYQGEYTMDQSWLYTTFDRVALHPYIYAMIFEKQ